LKWLFAICKGSKDVRLELLQGDVDSCRPFPETRARSPCIHFKPLFFAGWYISCLASSKLWVIEEEFIAIMQENDFFFASMHQYSLAAAPKLKIYWSTQKQFRGARHLRRSYFEALETICARRTIERPAGFTTAAVCETPWQLAASPHLVWFAYRPKSRSFVVATYSFHTASRR
jgi:hypothetical protein